MKRFTTILLTCLAASAAHADGVKTVTQQLLEKDAQLALQKLDQDLAKGNPAPTSVAAALASAEQRAHEAPKTIALYGVDGRAAGLPMALRSYVKWGDQVYAAKVGGSVRGYKVVSISESGTKLVRGKQTINAAKVDEDAVILAGEQAGSEMRSSSKPAGPLPVPGATTGVSPFPPAMPLPLPLPVAPAAPAQPAQVGALPAAVSTAKG